MNLSDRGEREAMDRVIPFWEDTIVPEIRKSRRILIVAHGTSLRGIGKNLEGFTTEEIATFNLPNSMPLAYFGILQDPQSYQILGR